MHIYSGQKKILFSVILIIAMGVAVYANSLTGQFVWDDEELIANNTLIKNWSHWPQLFTEDIAVGAGKESDYYRPLQMLTYMADYSLWGLDVRGYHVTNYARLLFVPVDLHMEYGNKVFPWMDLRVVLGMLISAALIVYALRKKEKEGDVFFAIAWFFVALLPVSNALTWPNTGFMCHR